MFDSILVVCVGNICRSPTGERMLKRLLPHKKIASAGLGAMVGHPADPSAMAVAEQNGLSLEHHSGAQLTKELCREYSLILVMERKHIDGVCRLAPEVRGKPCFLLTGLRKKISPIPMVKAPRRLNSSIVNWTNRQRNGQLF